MRLDYTKVKILQDAFVALINNKFLSDIKFKFPDGRIIYAHSFVLCCRSDEFCDSFENTVGFSKLIQVENATYEEYFEFLKYLYTDTCKIDESNATNIVQLSKKHELPGLEIKCIDGMLEDMSVENVCTILGRSIELELERLKTESTKFIAENYIAALNTESFLLIRDEALKAILELEPVSDNDEFKIFEATMKWAGKACRKDGLEASGFLKRRKLGDNFKLLRFGAMTGAEFTACINLEPDLLTNEEQISIYKSLTAGDKNTFGFADEKRQLILRNSDKVVLFRDGNITEKWKIIGNASFKFNMTFSVSQLIEIEDIDWNFYNDNDIKMIQFLENSAIIYKSPNHTGLINSKKLLHPNTRYTLNLTYNCLYNLYKTNTALKFQSEDGKCEFTVYESSSPIIKNLTFKYSKNM